MAKIDYTEFEKEAEENRMRFMEQLEEANLDEDAARAALSRFEDKVLKKRDEFTREAEVRAFTEALYALAKLHGETLELFVSSRGNNRLISFNPEVVGNGLHNPMMRLGLAAYVYKQVKKSV